jgi:predicted MPP superfamily phosphohydrolase
MINTKIKVFIDMESNKLEKTIEKMVESHFKNIKTPEDFHGIKVDVYPTKYGKVAHIAILMKKPFSGKDSDFLHRIGKEATNFVKTMFGDYLKGGISCGNSTIDSYNNTKWWYEEKKKLDENVKSVFVITESQYNVIKEEVEKDYTDLITKLMKKTILSEYSHAICDIKVTAPKDREVLDGQKPYLHYKINVYFIGGHGTKLWPRTQGVNDMYDKVMDTIWSTIYDYLGIATDIYKTYVPKCENKDQ